MNLLYLLIIPLSIFLLNFIFNKKNFLQSLTGDKHQLFIEKNNIPLTGGIILSIFSIIFFVEKIELFYFLIIFLIGILSDTKILRSAKLRFLLQGITILFLVLNFNLYTNDIRVPFLNYFLEYHILSYIFFTFCLLIVTNGSNFMDGLNGLVINYYLLILISILSIDVIHEVLNIKAFILNYIILLFYLLLFNLSNKLYLGDSGSYFLGVSVGSLLIFIYKEISFISPFFIVLLLWYPCFENLFSIIRKKKFNLSPLNADNKHLHHLLFYYFKYKYNLTKLSSNNISSILINFINLIFFIIGANYINNSFIQIILIFSLISIYIFFYIILFKFRYKKIY
ncbi:hypothetical protein OA967_00745 [Candidatus Pelagibacter sp.]|nr:hypothetical protein [Candidatus Pelagibacter sp.]